MKLGAVMAVAVSVGLMGCASSCPAPAAKSTAQAQAPVVSTTRLTSAELADTEYAPLVGKPQHGMAPKSDADVTEQPKDGRRHEGGGFSGWK